jgi:hypothetical protein
VIGFSGGLDRSAIAGAALWVPLCFVAAAVLAWLGGIRLRMLGVRR